MLTTMLFDDNPFSLVRLANLCVASQQLGRVYVYNSVEAAMTGARTAPVDFALLNMDNPGTVALGDMIRKLCPDAVLIYIIASGNQCVEALRHGADYFIMNPYQDKDVTDAIDRAVRLSRRPGNRLYVHTFGRFYVFHRDRAVYFKNSKSRELLALCVDRCGGNVSMEEVIDTLWPERPYDRRVKTLYRKAVMNLRQALNPLGLTDVFVTNRGECHINPDEIQCDYYEYLEGMEKAKNSYHREYMFDYTWAEETNTRLLREIYGENFGGDGDE